MSSTGDACLSSAPEVDVSTLPSWLTDLVSIAPALSVGVAILAFAVSALALIVAISSRRLAGKSYRLAEKKEDRQAAMMDLYVIETLQTIDAAGNRTIDVDFEITNRSEVASSIRSAGLWLNYENRGNAHRTEVSPAKSGIPAPAFPVPGPLDGRNTVRGWLRFELAARRTAGWTVLSFDLVLKDTDSRAVTYEGLSVNRRHDEA